MIAILTPLLTSLFTLFVKIKLLGIAFQLVIFMAIYQAFKWGMEESINIVLSRVDALSFPCTVLFILRELNIFEMLNFGLSFYAMVYTSKFFYHAFIRFI